jgi:hypothetical protein
MRLHLFTLLCVPATLALPVWHGSDEGIPSPAFHTPIDHLQDFPPSKFSIDDLAAFGWDDHRPTAASKAQGTSKVDGRDTLQKGKHNVSPSDGVASTSSLSGLASNHLNLVGKKALSKERKYTFNRYTAEYNEKQRLKRAARSDEEKEADRLKRKQTYATMNPDKKRSLLTDRAERYKNLSAAKKAALINQKMYYQKEIMIGSDEEKRIKFLQRSHATQLKYQEKKRKARAVAKMQRN